MKTAALDIETLRREQFPITRTWTYLNHATYGPLPRSSVEAAIALYRRMSEEMLGDLVSEWIVAVDQLRAKAARLINCQPEDVALLRSTTEGLSLVPQGLDWRPGDQVITYQLEFPSDVYPWMNLAHLGVEVRFVEDRNHRFTVEDVASLITPKTRAIDFSLVNFAHGFRAPLEQIGRMCQERGIWFVVDATQAMGALQVDARALGADIVCAHAYKFLLSGFGVAICYCSPRARTELRVAEAGWKSIEKAAEYTNMLNFNLDFARRARRFESGIQSLASVHSLAATLDLLLEVGPDVIEERVLGITEELTEGLIERGFEVLSSRVPSERSGIVSAKKESMDTPAIQRILAAEHIACAVREGRIRLSPHFYNTSEEVAKCLACLPS